jgi:hypothetical protein
VIGGLLIAGELLMIQQLNEFGDGLGRALSTVISVADDFLSIAAVVIPKEKPQRGTTAPGQAHNTNPAKPSLPKSAASPTEPPTAPCSIPPTA